MSLSSIMNTALTGLFTNQTALRVTSDNISNVNTPGYSRRLVHQEAVVNGYGGVRIADVERVVDRFLDEAKLGSTAQASRYGIERKFHDRIQAFLGRPDSETSLAARLDSMFGAVARLSQDPNKLVLRQDVLASIENFSSELSYLSSELQRMRADASVQISERLRKVNAALERVEALNPLIIKEKVIGRDTGSLEEQRAAALAELSELMDIRTHLQENGAVHVTTGNGTVLLANARYELRYSSPGTATAETEFGPITAHIVDPISGLVSSTGEPIDGAILGGEIRGLLNMRDKILPDMALELGRLGGTMVDQMNAVHNASTASPAVNAMTGRNTGLLGTDLHRFTGRTDFMVLDSAGAVVEKVTVDFSALPPGATLNDVVAAVNAGLGSATMSFANGVMTLSAGAGLGVAIVDDPAAASNRGGRGFSHFFGMNDLVATRVPTIYQTGFQGADAHGFTPGGTVGFKVIGADNRVLTNYTMTVGAGDFNSIVNDLNSSALAQYMTFSLDASGALVTTPLGGFSGAKLQVASDTTQRGGTGIPLSRLFGLGARYLADQASDVRVLDSIKNAPERFATGRIAFGAAVGAQALGVSNNEGAKALQALELTQLPFAATGKLGAFSGTMGQYAASILSNMGLMADDASSREADATALKQEIVKRRDDVSGVNLDEELSNMVTYQNSYNAAARIISTVQEMYDTLLAIVR